MCALLLMCLTGFSWHGNVLHAQKIKPLPVKPILPKTISVRPSATVKRAALRAAKQPDIRLSVARMDHALLLGYPMHKRPHSTAFLFETTYQGKREIWAATAGHTAQEKEPLLLTFYDGKKEYPVRGTLVQQGPALLSDMALIQLQHPLPAALRPLTLAEDLTQTTSPLTTWGYASNKLYHIDELTFEKDNTRFIRTDFPDTQRKRAGLCGGPLLNNHGQVLGVHCGSSPEDKSYAASVRMIPYLLQAYHTGSAEVPLVIQGQTLGYIQINERIMQIHCLDQSGNLLEIYEVYDQLHQSDIVKLLQDPEIHSLQFVLGSYLSEFPKYRSLIYNKHTQTYHFEEFSTRR